MPVASIKKRIGAFFCREIGACKNRSIVDCLKYLIRKCQMFFTFPDDPMFCQHMVVPTDTKTNTSVLLVRQFCIRCRIEVQIDHIIQGTDRCCNDFFHIRRIFYREMAKREAGKVAHHKFSGFCDSDHNGIPVHSLNFFCYFFDGLHILCDFCTEIGAVDFAGMSVWIHSVDRISIESKRGSGFCG